MTNIAQSLKRFSQVWYIGYSAQGGVSLGLAPIFLPIVVASYTGASEAGLIIAIFYFAQMLAPFWGWLSDRLNCHRGVFIASYVLVGLGVGLFPLIPDMSYWFVMSFILGLGIGASNTLAEMYIIEFQPKSEWDDRIGWLQMFFGVGQAAGLYLAFFLAHDANMGLYVAGILMIPSLIVGLIQLPHVGKRQPVKRSEQDTGPLSSRTLAALSRHMHNIQYFFKNFPQALHSLFALYLTAWLAIMFGNWLIYNLYPLLMNSVFHMNASSSSLYFAIGSTFAVPACPISGWLANKIGEGLVMILGILMSLVASLGMFLLACYPVPADIYLVPITFMFLPVAWSPLIIVGTAMVTKLTNLTEGESIGVFTAATAMASLVAALAAGFLADNLGFIYVLLLSSCFTVLSLILIIILRMRIKV